MGHFILKWYSVIFGIRHYASVKFEADDEDDDEDPEDESRRRRKRKRRPGNEEDREFREVEEQFGPQEELQVNFCSLI